MTYNRNSDKLKSRSRRPKTRMTASSQPGPPPPPPLPLASTPLAASSSRNSTVSPRPPGPRWTWAITPPAHQRASNSALSITGVRPGNQLLCVPAMSVHGPDTTCQSASTRRRMSATQSSTTAEGPKASPDASRRVRSLHTAASSDVRNVCHKSACDGRWGRHTSSLPCSQTEGWRGGGEPPLIRTQRSASHVTAGLTAGQYMRAWGRVSGLHACCKAEPSEAAGRQAGLPQHTT